MKLIKDAKPSFNDYRWSTITDEAKNLILKMLLKDEVGESM